MKILRNIFLIFLFTFILVEITFRLIPKSIIPNLGPNKINIDFFDYGPWFVPNQKTSFSNACSFVYPITTNKFGMRDKNRKIEKNKKIRIAVLGDSIMEALQVPDYKYSSILIENILNEKNYDVEVLNFSFSGYGTAQQLAIYNILVKNFDPDIVLLFTLASNDLRNNSMQLEYLAYGKDLNDYGSQSVPPFSYYEYQNEKLIFYPNLVTNSKLKKILKKYVFYNIYTIDYLKNLYLKFTRIKNIKKIKKQLNTEKNISNDIKNNSDKASKKSIAKLYDHAKINSSKIIQNLKVQIENNNGKLIQVIYNDNVENSKFFEKIAQENSINYLNFGPKDNGLYKKYLNNNNIQMNMTHNICDGHPNEIGHKIIAEITSQWLIKILKD